jgi:hypothetical protein
MRLSFIRPESTVQLSSGSLRPKQKPTRPVDGALDFEHQKAILAANPEKLSVPWCFAKL